MWIEVLNQSQKRLNLSTKQNQNSKEMQDDFQNMDRSVNYGCLVLTIVIVSIIIGGILYAVF